MSTDHFHDPAALPAQRIYRLPEIVGRLLRALSLAALLTLAPHTAQATEKLSICYATSAAALVPLAQLQGYFAAEGLDIEARSFPSGRQALEAMFAGKCTLSTVAETPVTHYSLSRNDFRIIASISTFTNFERLIVRSDRSIHSAANLRGRRIAVPQFTTAHYFLDLYLTTHGLKPHDVIQVYLPAQEVVQAFRLGTVDSAALWEPHIQNLADEFGTRAQIFTAPSLHISPFLLVGNHDYLIKNLVTIERFLHALVHTEHYAQEQPTRAKTLIAQIYKLSQREVDITYPLFDFHIALEQTLPLILESAARWEIDMLPPRQRPPLPNYLNLLLPDLLKRVNPAAVTLIY